MILCIGFQDVPQQFDTKQEYVYQDELYGLEGRPLHPLARNHLLTHPEDGASTSGRGEGVGVHYGPQWGLLTLSQPVTASEVSCCMNRPVHPPRGPPQGVDWIPLCMIVSLEVSADLRLLYSAGDTTDRFRDETMHMPELFSWSSLHL